MTKKSNDLNTGNGPRKYFSSGTSAKKIPFDSIPVIDFSAMFGDDQSAKIIVGEAVRKACTEVGFFYVKNHRVDDEIINNTFDAAESFFNATIEKKLEVNIENSEALRGYTALLASGHDDTGKADFHEGFDLALDLDHSDEDVKSGVFGYAPNQWPTGMDSFKSSLTTYHSSIVDFGKKIFESFALALELPTNHFEGAITKPMAHMRVLHYPPQDPKSKKNQMGIGAHSDYECFTVLCTSGVPALQVLNTDGVWIQAPPIEGTFIVNVGDLMARWTNDYFQSTVHRAINLSGKRRYSIPFFYGPNSKEIIEVLPSCQSKTTIAKYEPIEAGEYIKSRFDDTYVHRQEEN